MQTLIKNELAEIREILSRSFQEGIDGYWMPDEAGTPLVRVQIAESGYQIERRRTGTSPWAPIVTATLTEFDATAFSQWRTNWPMVAN